MKKLAIIPARGGSKRIPGKNIREFKGKPMIAYPIGLALESGLFDEVMVSTDDPEIAAIALQHGAKVPFMRSAANADDHATTIDVLLEVLDAYQKMNQEFEMACCIYPATPLLRVKQLKAGMELLEKENFDTTFASVPFGSQVLRALTIGKNGKAQLNWPQYQFTRTQDLPVLYHDAGQFYWFKTQVLLKEKAIFTKNCGAIQLSEVEVQDIDNETDWKLAELKYEYLQGLK